MTSSHYIIKNINVAINAYTNYKQISIENDFNDTINGLHCTTNIIIYYLNIC